MLSGFSTLIQRTVSRHLILPALLASLVGLGWPIASVVADDHESGHPLLTVQLDFDAFNESKLGRSLIKAGTTLAAQQLEKDPEEAMTALIESLGFDPMEQEIRISAQISSLEDPMDGLTIDVQMKDSTGNLEGLLLAAPGYQETEIGGQTFHSVSMDGETFFIAFCDGSNGKKRMIAGQSQAAISDCIDAIQTGSASDVDARGEMVMVKLHQMPEELSEVPPVANIASMIRDTSLSIAENDGQLVTTISLTAETEERAEQLQQLVQGAVAMIGLFKEEIQVELQGEEVASAVIPVLDQIKVSQEGSSVSVTAEIPESLIMEFLSKEAGLPL